MNNSAYSAEEFQYYCNELTSYYAKHGTPFFQGKNDSEKRELRAILDEGNNRFRAKEGMKDRNLLSVQTKLKSFALNIPGVSITKRRRIKPAKKQPVTGNLHELLAKYDSANEVVTSTAHRKKEIDIEHSVALREVSAIKKELKKYSGMLRKRGI